MNNAIAIEMQFFLISIVSGCILIFAYDILRVLRRVVKHNEFIIGIEDLIFWVISSLFIFIMMYYQNNGIIRMFSILGMVLGMILYHNLVSDFFIALSIKIINLLLSPIIFIINWVKRILTIICRSIHKILNVLLLRLKKLILSVKIAIITNKQKKAIQLEGKRNEKTAKKELLRKEKEEKHNLNRQQEKKKKEEKQRLKEEQAKNNLENTPIERTLSKINSVEKQRMK